jgi:hypothetical protein
MSYLADSNPHPRCVKVAVVGSGLAGLTAAHLLSTVHQRADIRYNGRPVEYEVHVFEKVCVCSPPSPDKVCLTFRCRDTLTPLLIIFYPIHCAVMRLSGQHTRNGFSLGFIYVARRDGGMAC